MTISTTFYDGDGKIIPKTTEENEGKTAPKSFFPLCNRSLVEDVVLRCSPNSCNSSKHVVIVMDAMKDFSSIPLQWALDHVISPGYSVTLLGVMPWLNLPLSCKTWLDVWTLNLQDLSALRKRSEWQRDTKYLRVRKIMELCSKYGVIPYMKVAMGYPLRLRVLEQTTSLHATWVVIDRHLKRHRRFYAKRIPCNMVMMNRCGEVDMLKVRPMISKGDYTPGQSPACVPIVPKVIISEKLREILRQKEQEKNDSTYASEIRSLNI